MQSQKFRELSPKENLNMSFDNSDRLKQISVAEQFILDKPKPNKIGKKAFRNCSNDKRATNDTKQSNKGSGPFYFQGKQGSIDKMKFEMIKQKIGFNFLQDLNHQNVKDYLNLNLAKTHAKLRKA